MRVPEPLRVLAPAAALVCLLATAAGAEAQAVGTPRADAELAVRETTDAVLAVLHDDALSTQAKHARIEALAYEHFDFRTIARLVLARNWRRLSPEQREDFIREFKRHISLSYGNGLDAYGDETVEFGNSRLERNGDVTVRTEIHGARATPIAVDYRLREKDGSWYVIDVIIESVSLLLNFRSQVQAIVTQVGPEGLIDRLREKNAERDSDS